LETVTRYINNLHDLLITESSTAERKSFTKRFVKEVIVKDNERSLDYTFLIVKTDPQIENPGASAYRTCW
jgi:hypothetical protein